MQCRLHGVTQRSTFPLHDRLVDGDLKAILTDYRLSGESFVEIAFKLRSQGIEVSPSTVHRWCHDLGIEAS